jgi:hypothetical protein
MTFKYEIGRGQITLTFSGKPSAQVRDTLKANGFRWSPSGGYWWRSRVAGAADLINAVQKQLDRETGTRRPDGPCWECKAPDGYFRPFAASTPVYCDQCHGKHQRDPKSPYHIPTESAPDITDLLYEDACRAACGL